MFYFCLKHYKKTDKKNEEKISAFCLFFIFFFFKFDTVNVNTKGQYLPNALLKFFLLYVNFSKSTTELYFLLMSFVLTKFLEYQRLTCHQSNF